MFNVRLAGGHLYGKQLFTWLSLVVSLMASIVLSFFPLDVLDEIWDLIESVSEGFLTYSFILSILSSFLQTRVHLLRVGTPGGIHIFMCLFILSKIKSPLSHLLGWPDCDIPRVWFINSLISSRH